MSFRLVKGTVVEDVDGIAVIIAENGDSAVLNGSAAAIVSAFLDSATEVGAVERLLGIYDVEEPKLIEDMYFVAGSLCKHGMLEGVNL